MMIAVMSVIIAVDRRACNSVILGWWADLALSGAERRCRLRILRPPPRRRLFTAAPTLPPAHLGIDSGRSLC